MTRGILYVATGEAYIKEAQISAMTVKNNLSCETAIVSDQDIQNDIFDKVITLEDPNYGSRDKIRGLKLSPFDKTIYLDTDTYILHDIEELFDLLSHFDVAATHSPHEWTTRIIQNTVDGVPSPVPEYNTGVIPFQSNQRTSDLFNCWLKHYANTAPKDQPAFRAALTEADVNFTSMPRIYNYIYRHPSQFTGTVKLLHDVDRFLDSSSGEKKIRKIDNRINSTRRPRINYHVEDRIVSPDAVPNSLAKFLLLMDKGRMFIRQHAKKIRDKIT